MAGDAASRAEPLRDSDFEELMAGLGPFEPAPWLAVGLSGGSDSLALAALAGRWAAARGGRVTALIVDHGLRRGSRGEARGVAAQAAGLGLEPVVLTWRGAKPEANLQAEARRARHALLRDWCRRHGLLHLLLGQQRDDQAETLLLNLARGSGLDGLAAMAPLVETPDLRILRPLLGVPRARLRAGLRAAGLDWLEDPSNRDPRFGRSRLRGALAGLTDEPLLERRLADAAGHLGRARVALEAAVAELLARAARLADDGSLRLRAGALAAAPEEVSLRALAGLLATVGGADYPPRFERLLRLHAALTGPDLAGFKGATLGGCRLRPGREGAILVVREAAKVPRLALEPGARGLWDGRFRYRLGRPAGLRGRALSLGPLGTAGGRALALPGPRPPAPVRAPLPAFGDADGLLAVPQLGYYRDPAARKLVQDCHFAPRRPLIGGEFTVA